MNSSSLSHTKWKCQYHIVFIPKYRRKVLYGQVMADTREIIKKLCAYKNIEIVAALFVQIMCTYASAFHQSKRCQNLLDI